MARVCVDVRSHELVGYVRQLPRRIRWEPQRRWLWTRLPAFVPALLLLLAFGLELPALLTVALLLLLPVITLRRLARNIPVYVVPTTVSLDDDGVTLDMHTVVRRWPWWTITDIHEGEQLLCVVYMHGRHWLLIPRASFAGPDECASFLAEAHQLRARHGQIPAGAQARGPSHTKLPWGMTALFWVPAVGLGYAAWIVDSVWLRVAIGIVAIVLFVVGWPEPTRIEEAPGHAADSTAVRISESSSYANIWIGVWMVAILLLDAAVASDTTLRVMFGVPGVAASWIASGTMMFDLLDAVARRGPRVRVQELRIDGDQVVLDSVEGRISTTWAQLAPAKIQARTIELSWPGGYTFVKVPRSAFVSEAHWSSFIEKLPSTRS